MSKEQVKDGWRRYAQKAGLKMNDDEIILDMLAEGILKNRASYGFNLCPCKVSSGKKEEDIKHICPCNFKEHDVWETQGRCWCGLFLKKE